MSIGKRIAELRKLTRKEIHVPAWDSEEYGAFVMYTKELSCGDVDKIQRKHKDFINNPTISAMVDMIIFKAEDKKGEKMFTLEDRPTLMNERLETISIIAGEIFGQTESVEEKEKN